MHASSEGRAEAARAELTPTRIENAMRRAIVLAQNGPAWGVNPQVGCVLLGADGRFLAEGWHRGAGTPHAEVDALAQLASPGLAEGGIAVVTLEPCNHTGRTGPCSTALIDAGIASVYFGVPDPGAASAGGADRLEAAGVRVQGGVLADEVEQGIRSWLTAVRLGRPFVTVKWASSLDGRAGAADGSSQWITGPDARLDVHVRRSRVDAIVVGTGTVRADDPALTARGADGGLLDHQPSPVVIGTRAVAVAGALARHPEAVAVYATRDLDAVLSDLFSRGVRSVFVEGGPTLASAFLAAGLADEVVVYLAPSLIGGPLVALGELGVASIQDARRFVFDSVDLLGGDLRLVARPAATPIRPWSARGRPHTAPRAIATAVPTPCGTAAPATARPDATTSAPQKETTRVHRNH